MCKSKQRQALFSEKARIKIPRAFATRNFLLCSRSRILVKDYTKILETLRKVFSENRACRCLATFSLLHLHHMITKRTHKNLIWIDLENPIPSEVSSLIEDFEIHPNWADELTKPTERAKTETIGHVFYAALHYPSHPSHHHAPRTIEIDFIIGRDFIITSHYEPIDVILDNAKKFDVEETLGHMEMERGTDLFLSINNELYRDLREELESFRREIKKIEDSIFSGSEFRMVREISYIHRRLLDFKQTLRAHKIILKSFELNSQKLLDESVSQDIIFKDYTRVESALENNLELIKELRSTNDSLLTAKNNDVIKKLTLMAFVTFPLTLVATVLEYQYAPHIFHSREGFWLIVAVLVILFLMMQIYFVYKKWI